jgi:hypothetical protein
MKLIIQTVCLLLVVTSCFGFIGIPKLCLSVYDKSESLRKEIDLLKFKNKILEIASHPEFEKDDFDLNAHGPRLRFLHPLIHHMIQKASVEMDKSVNVPAKAKFESEKVKWLEELKNDQMTYKAMLILPTTISFLLSASKTDWWDPKFRPYGHDMMTHPKFKNKGIFPLPMFFTPDFELRTRLWVLDRPMISVVKNDFYSQLDSRHYSIADNIVHDWFHAYASLGKEGVITSKIKRRAGNQALLSFTEKLTGVERKIGFFLLHVLIPEGPINYRSLADTKQEIAAELKNEMRRFSTDEKYYDWTKSALGLVGLRIETAPGEYLRLEKNESDGSLYFAEGSDRQYREYFEKVANDFEAGIGKTLEELFHQLKPSKKKKSVETADLN